MDITNFKLFLDVVRLGSFAAVARDVDTDPSSISRQIAALETDLGYRLFDRTTRRLALTEAGQLTFDRIQNPLSEIDEVQTLARDMVNEPQGHLRMSASVAFAERWLVPRLAKFQDLYPKIQIELVLCDSKVDLIEDKIDLTIRLGSQTDGDYMVTKLFNAKYHVAASPDYLKQYGAINSPPDIAKHKCVTFPLAGYRSLWRFQGPDGKDHNVNISPSIIISNALSIRRALVEGMGIGLVSEWTINEDLKNGRLISIMPDYRVTAGNFDEAIWLLYPSRSYVPAKTRAMIDYLKSCEP